MITAFDDGLQMQRPSIEAAESLREALRLKGYELHEQLGRGHFGSVYRATNARGDNFAIKLGAREREAAFKDMNDLTKGSYPRRGLVRMFDHFPELDALVMEFLPLGSLESLLVRRKVPLPWAWRLRLATMIADTMTILLARGIQHRDLRCCNVMLDRNGDPVVADFGISVSVKQEASGPAWPITSVCDTGTYGRRHYSSRHTDLEFFGVLLIRLLQSGPAAAEKVDISSEHAQSIDLDVRIPPEYSPYRQLISLCLNSAGLPLLDFSLVALALGRLAHDNGLELVDKAFWKESMYRAGTMFSPGERLPMSQFSPPTGGLSFLDWDWLCCMDERLDFAASVEYALYHCALAQVGRRDDARAVPTRLGVPDSVTGCLHVLAGRCAVLLHSAAQEFLPLPHAWDWSGPPASSTRAYLCAKLLVELGLASSVTSVLLGALEAGRADRQLGQWMSSLGLPASDVLSLFDAMIGRGDDFRVLFNGGVEVVLKTDIANAFLAMPRLQAAVDQMLQSSGFMAPAGTDLAWTNGSTLAVAVKLGCHDPRVVRALLSQFAITKRFVEPSVFFAAPLRLWFEAVSGSAQPVTDGARNLERDESSAPRKNDYHQIDDFPTGDFPTSV